MMIQKTKMPKRTMEKQMAKKVKRLMIAQLCSLVVMVKVEVIRNLTLLCSVNLGYQQTNQVNLHTRNLSQSKLYSIMYSKMATVGTQIYQPYALLTKSRKMKQRISMSSSGSTEINRLICTGISNDKIKRWRLFRIQYNQCHIYFHPQVVSTTCKYSWQIQCCSADLDPRPRQCYSQYLSRTLSWFRRWLTSSFTITTRHTSCSF